jgi:hypothetical protein
MDGPSSLTLELALLSLLLLVVIMLKMMMSQNWRCNSMQSLDAKLT